MKKYFTYILECADNSFYTGSTNNLKNRILKHNQGKGAHYTKIRRPVKLIYYETYNSLRAARQREAQIKGWTRMKKQNLIKYN